MSKGPWDQRGQGSWDFTEQQYRQVIDYLKANHVGVQNAVLTRDLAAVFPGVEGRALRGIQAKADGVEAVLCSGDWGVFVAEYQEDAERSAARLFSQARKMNSRGRRKLQFAMEQLPRRQETMLPPAEEPEDNAPDEF